MIEKLISWFRPKSKEEPAPLPPICRYCDYWFDSDESMGWMKRIAEAPAEWGLCLALSLKPVENPRELAHHDVLPGSSITFDLGNDHCLFLSAPWYGCKRFKPGEDRR